MLLWFYFYFILPFFYSAMSFVYRKLLNYFFFGNKILVIVSARYPAIQAQLFQGSPSCHYRHSMPFPKFTCHARLVLTWHSCCSRKVVQKAGHKSKHICNFWCWCNFTAEKAQLFSFPIHETPPPPFFWLTWPPLRLMGAWAHIIGFLVCKLCFWIGVMVTTWHFFVICGR